jgi:branched-chain amino acid transport system substrate-binding protein
LQGSGADVFFNITIPKFAAQAIRKAYDIGWKPVHFLNNVSQSIGTVLKPAGLEKSIGIISSTYGKDPTDPTWDNDAGMNKWRAFMKKYYPEGSLIQSENVYGYGVAQVLHQVLKQAGNDLTRANIMKQAASLKNFETDVGLPGIKINTSPNDFAPIQQVQMMRFDGKTWVRFGPILGAE